MKRIILLALLVLTSQTDVIYADTTKNISLQNQVIKEELGSPGVENDTLIILWTSGDPDVALKMVFMYAGASKSAGWWSHVHLIVWGPSSKLSSENIEIQKAIASLLEAGVVVEACKACANQYGVSEKLHKLGMDVKYMGKPLTEHLKAGRRVITF